MKLSYASPSSVHDIDVCAIFTGHYVALVKSHDNWLFFDDEQVEPIPESVVRTTFGSTQEYSNHMDHGYILMYEMQDSQKSQIANGDS